MTVMAREPSGAAAGRILVVEDDGALRGLMVKTLGRAGFAVEGVATGGEAVERILADSGQALLLDQHLSDQSGRDVVVHLAGRGVKVPFVMMTGRGDERLAVEMMKLGAYDYLVKDVGLVDRLAGVFGRLFQAVETERRLRETESALREGEARYRELVENANSVILRMDKRGDILFFNEYAQRFFGYKAEEAMGRSVIGTIVPETDSAGRDLREMILDIGVHPECYASNENENMLRDGRRVWLSWSNRPLYDAAGEVCEILSVGTDITARKRAEEALRAERTRLLALTDSARDAIVMLDPGGAVSFWNPAAEQMFGYSFEEAKGRELHGLLAPDRYRAAYGEAFARFRESGKGDALGGTLEVAACGKDGREIPVELSLAAMELADGWHAVGILRDISARKEAERMLRFQSLVLGQIQDCVTVTDLEGRIVYVNEAEIQLMGYAPEELIGASTEKYGEDPARGARQREILDATLRDGYWRGEVVNYTRAGCELILDCRTQVVLDDRGQRIALCGVSTDITERKRAEAALRANEEMFRGFFENHAAVKLLVDPGTGDIVDANQAAASYYGWPRERLRRMRIQEINTMPPKELACKMEQAAGGADFNFEFRHRLADGSVRDVEVFSSAVSMKGRLVLYSIIHDITDRKLAEAEQEKLREQLLQVQKLDSVGQLAGGVAHDFNNMLQGIIGYTELAIEQVEPSEPLYADLLEINKTAERAAELTRQLLAFARKQAVSPKVLDLNSAVGDMLAMLRRLIGEGVRLAWVPSPISWSVRIDPMQVHMVLANLCINARDAIDGTGRIVIECRNRSLDEAFCASHVAAKVGDYVMLAVSDNGCGMSKETLDKVFDPFFTTKEAGKGTGLGLSMVHGVLMQNGGFVRVYSELGKGTTFLLYLPRHLGAAAPADVSGSAPVFPKGDETILVAEDEPVILAFCREVLGRLGYTVLLARTPHEALDLAGNHPGLIDLLLTDVVMPDLDGRRLMEQVERMRPGISCIYMSGYTASAIAQHGILEEGVHFLQKPFTSADVACKVREVLDGAKQGEEE